MLKRWMKTQTSGQQWTQVPLVYTVRLCVHNTHTVVRVCSTDRLLSEDQTKQVTVVIVSSSDGLTEPRLPSAA